MKIALLGATGFVGSAILNEALNRGHTVTAIVRHPEKLKPHGGLIATAGDVNDPENLAKLFAGQDAIVSAFNSVWKNPNLSTLGAAMSAATYLITLTFFLSIPGVAEATAGGFPAISAAPGQFLLKDLALLAASLSLLLASVQGPWLNVQKS